jgi:hypothetical protein
MMQMPVRLFVGPSQSIKIDSLESSAALRLSVCLPSTLDFVSYSLLPLAIKHNHNTQNLLL